VIGASATDLFGEFHAVLWQNGHISDLGTLAQGPYASSSGLGINSLGEAVGYTHVHESDPPHAFIYRRGRMRDLGTGFGPGSQSAAYDVNSTRQAAGERAKTQSGAQKAVL